MYSIETYTIVQNACWGKMLIVLSDAWTLSSQNGKNATSSKSIQSLFNVYHRYRRKT